MDTMIRAACTETHSQGSELRRLQTIARAGMIGFLWERLFVQSYCRSDHLLSRKAKSAEKRGKSSTSTRYSFDVSHERRVPCHRFVRIWVCAMCSITRSRPRAVVVNYSHAYNFGIVIRVLSQQYGVYLIDTSLYIHYKFLEALIIHWNKTEEVCLNNKQSKLS